MNRLELESTLKKSQINALKTNVTFYMFNSLNNMRFDSGKSMKSREMITRLSEMLRYSLTKVKSIPLHLRKKLKWSKTLSPFQNSTGRSIAIYFRNRRETLRPIHP
jgi:LytS/YehU family sensor histidine kinase